MNTLLRKIAVSMLAMALLFSAIPAHADSSFAQSCKTYGYYGLEDWYFVQLQDINTSQISDSCKADDWSIMVSGAGAFSGSVVKGTQDVKIKRQAGDLMVDVRAKKGSEMTESNYLTITKANEAGLAYVPLNLHFSVLENNIGLLWNPSSSTASLGSANSYAVMMKKGSDFTDADLATNVEPIHVPIGTTQYTFENLDNGTYYFKVGTGFYNGGWESYGNYSSTATWKLGSKPLSERCKTYGYYSLEDWYVVQLLDITTGKVTDSCKATDWTIMINGGGAFTGTVEKSAQEVKFKRQPTEISVDVRAKNGSEFTEDNYLTIAKANSTVDTLAPAAGYEDEVVVNMSNFKNPFTDTDVSSLEGKAAAELYRRAVIGGYPDGGFKGNKDVNRAEAAKFLLLARYGAVATVSNNGKFSDVKEGQWYVPFVVTAAGKGIIAGYTDGTFRPQSTVKTSEFLKMLTLTFGLSENQPYTYTDVSASDWFARFAGTAVKYKLFPDRTTKLNPNSLMSRKEVAIAIYQFLANR